MNGHACKFEHVHFDEMNQTKFKKTQKKLIKVRTLASRTTCSRPEDELIMRDLTWHEWRPNACKFETY